MLHETLRKPTGNTSEASNKAVQLYVQSTLFTLHGSWEWDFHSDTIYCSDVMSFPPDFEGTKAIVHPEDLARLKAFIEVIQEDSSADLEFSVITTYGEIHRISGENVHLSQDPEKSVRTFERLGLEEARRERNNNRELESLRLRAQVIDLSEKVYAAGSWFINKSTGEVWYSDNVFRLHGLVPQSLNSNFNSFTSFIHPDERAGVVDALEKGYADQIPVHLEYRIITAAGVTRYIQQTTKWLFNNRGEPVFSGTIRDLTHEIELDHELQNRDSELRIQRDVLSYSGQIGSWGYWLLNLVTRKAKFSDNYSNILGIRQPGSININSLLNLVHPDDRERVQALVDQMYREHVLPESTFRIIRPDGKMRYLRQSGKIFVHAGSELLMRGILQDITVEKTLESRIFQLNQKIHLQKSLYELVEQNTDYSSVVWLQDGSVLWSDGFYRLLGYKPGLVEPVQQLFQKTIHPEDLKKFKDAIALVQNQQQHEDLLIRIISRYGVRSIRIIFRQIVLDNLPAAVGLIQDTTNYDVLQHRMAENARFASVLQDTINDVVISSDLSHTVISWNQRAEEKTGIKSEIALQQNLFDIFPSLNNETYLGQLQAVFAGSEIAISGTLNGYLKQAHNYYLTPLKLDEDKVSGVLHVVQDISKELELQQRLTERLHFIEHLIEASVDRIVVLDANMNYIYWNRNAEEYYAIRKDRVLGKNILEIFPKFRNDPSYREFRRVLKGETVHLPATIDPDTQQYTETWLTPIKDEADHVYAVLWVVHDLSKEFHLQQEHQKAQRVLDTINDACYELDSDGIVLFVNRHAADLFGIDKMAMQGSNIWDLVPESVDKTHYETVQVNALSKKQFSQCEYKCSVLDTWISLTATPTDDGCIVLIRVIEDIIQTRSSLQEEHKRLKEAQSIGHLGSFEWKADGKGIRWSDEMFRIHGLQAQSEEITHDRANSFIHPDDRHAFDRAMLSCRTQPRSIEVTHRIIRADGVLRNLYRRVQSFADEDGRIMEFRGAAQDITEQVDATTKIKASEALLRAAEEAALTGSYEADVATMQFHFSDGLFRIFGEPPQSFVPTLEYIDSKTHTEDIERARETLRVAILEKQSFYCTRRIYHPDGDLRIIETHGKVVCNEYDQPVKLIGLVQDITERRKSEQQLEYKNQELQRRNEEIAAFAFVASHDLREPIRKILSFSEFLIARESNNLSSHGEKYLNRIENAVRRLNLMINDLMALTQIHETPANFEYVDLNEVLTEAKNELREWAETSRATIESGNLLAIHGIRQQLVHLFYNLISNGLKFEPGRDAPWISIQSEEVEITASGEGLIRGRKYIKLSFVDNKMGFDIQSRKQMFEIFPRLSSRNFKEGTGIGLGICRKIMENHNGFIQVDGEENKESGFSCYFPLLG